MAKWTDKNGKVSDNYTCTKCKFKHYDLSKMQVTVMTKYKSLPVHMLCPCGKDLGKFGL